MKLHRIFFLLFVPFFLLAGDGLRGSYYNREASNIKYGDGEAVSLRGPSPVEGTNWSLGGKLTLTPNVKRSAKLGS